MALSNNLQKLTAGIQKKYDKNMVSVASETTHRDIVTHHTGSLMLDVAIGARDRAGIPEGRFIEIYGDPSTGKTTIAFIAIAARQAEEKLRVLEDPDHVKKFCVFVDAEHAMDLTLAEEYGVDLDELIIIDPETAEEAMDVLDAYIRSGEVGLAIVDSVSALVPSSIEQASFEQKEMATLARFMSQVCMKLTGPAFKNKTSIIFVNQLREQVGRWSPTGISTTSPGGRALKFYSTVRLEVKRGEPIKEGTENVGHKIRVRVVKNKVGVPFKEATISLVYGKGIDKSDELLQIALKQGLIVQGGAWYSYVDPDTGEIISFNDVQMRSQGKVNMLEFIRTIPEFFNELEAKVRGTVIELDNIDEELLDAYKKESKEGE